ncbi:MAG: glycerol-3-phosphate acyltransferase [Chloroflexi bacterium]|nr:glycerol-3-phosphate acyltransferase [Chloroflexota bacterium]
MTWVVVLLSYLLGSVPTGYIAGRLLKGQDIRRMGDGNMGAANVFREVGSGAGITVGVLDAAKGTLAVLIGQSFHAPQLTVLLAGIAAVAGHNWPVFLGFRGGRGASTTIGVLLVLVSQPLLITSAPALLTLILTKNVTPASAVLFVPLPFIEWWMGISGILIVYSIALPGLVGFTHFARTRHTITRQV